MPINYPEKKVKMSTDAVIVAAGRGTRAGGDTPKQWRSIAGNRVIDWTLNTFRAVEEIRRIALVLHADDTSLIEPCEGLVVVAGGSERSDSVKRGLEALNGPNSPEYVLIHDAVRCCISIQAIKNIIHLLHHGDTHAVAPALPVSDALWREKDGLVAKIKKRDKLYRAQTPQAFRFKAILDAHRRYQGPAADDVGVAHAAGIKISMVEGSEDNIKITTPGDFERARRILHNGVDIRAGTGFDVHRFCKGTAVLICGMEIPFNRSLEGHSDADVGMHAITDAIYGAIAEGDIGRHFPPSDPKWKGADSRVFLDHAKSLAMERGYAISNIDVTIICEMPKIAPHAKSMIIAISEMLGIETSRVSVKATTSEGLGFTGTGEGIAAQAIAMLVRQ